MNKNVLTNVAVCFRN